MRAFLLSVANALQSSLTAFLVSYTNRIFGFEEEYLSIPNLSRRSVLDDGFNDWLDTFVRNNNFDSQLGDQADFILSTTISFSVALLSAVSADFSYRHTLDTEVRECFLNRVELVRPYNRLYFCHAVLASIHQVG